MPHAPGLPAQRRWGRAPPWSPTTRPIVSRFPDAVPRIGAPLNRTLGPHLVDAILAGFTPRTNRPN